MERIDLLQGALDMLIPRTLQWGAQHGHGIGVAIRADSDDALQVEHGSLCPALHRLRKQGLIDAEWSSARTIGAPVITTSPPKTRRCWRR
jgi:PadR family transcriptional regulator PadR